MKKYGFPWLEPSCPVHIAVVLAVVKIVAIVKDPLEEKGKRKERARVN
jgi:hypothetical protein